MEVVIALAILGGLIVIIELFSRGLRNPLRHRRIKCKARRRGCRSEREEEMQGYSMDRRIDLIQGKVRHDLF
jgi:hypothetical protein